MFFFVSLLKNDEIRNILFDPPYTHYSQPDKWAPTA